MLELVILVHFGFIVWAVAGGFMVIRWWWVAVLHLPALVWGVLIELYGWACPLTPLEMSLRRERGLEVYDTGFIENYITPLIYPEGLTRELQMELAGGLVLVNVIAYGLAIYKHVLRR